MSDLTELVARALCEHDLEPQAFKSLANVDEFAVTWHSAAQAALKALSDAGYVVVLRDKPLTEFENGD